MASLSDEPFDLRTDPVAPELAEDPRAATLQIGRVVGGRYEIRGGLGVERSHGA